MSSLIAWILRAIPFGTIIMYGALGETLTEKSGNLNLGVPGIMYLGGFAGFASAYYYEKLSANPSAFVIANDISGVGRISSNQYTLIPFAEKILAEISANKRLLLRQS